MVSVYRGAFFIIIATFALFPTFHFGIPTFRSRICFYFYCLLFNVLEQISFIILECSVLTLLRNTLSIYFYYYIIIYLADLLIVDFLCPLCFTLYKARHLVCGSSLFVVNLSSLRTSEIYFLNLIFNTAFSLYWWCFCPD